MKKISLKLSLFVCILLSCFSCSKDSDEWDEDLTYFERATKCMNMPRPADSYDYPVYPGMAEWALFTSTQEMIDACLISPEMLKNMSTQAVIQAIWEYPFFWEILIRPDHSQMDFETVISQTNAYLELVTRSDAGECLLERYEYLLAVPYSAILPMSFEILFSQSVFLSQLNMQEKKYIVKEAFEKDRQRQNNKYFANDVSREISWLFIGRAMQSANYEQFMEEVKKMKI